MRAVSVKANDLHAIWCSDFTPSIQITDFLFFIILKARIIFKSQFILAVNVSCRLQKNIMIDSNSPFINRINHKIKKKS